MNDFIELNRIFNIIRKRWWLLVGLTVIGVTLGFIISRKQIPVYEAKVTVLVGEITKSSNLSREDIQMSELFAQTYAELAVRQPVLNGVVEKLGLNENWEELGKRIHVTPVSGTQMIEIKVEANAPDAARSIADEVANHLILLGPASMGDGNENIVRSFIRQQMQDTQLRILSGQERVKEIETEMNSPISSARMLELQTEKTNLERLIADHVLNFVELSNLATRENQPNSLSIIEPAYAENVPVRPRVTLNMLLSGGLGMLLALGIIFVMEFMNDVIKTTDDLAQFDKLSVLGAVGKIRGHKYWEKIVTHLEPTSPTTESYYMIRNKIRFGSNGNPAKTIVVTSPEPEEGKSITAANLGVIMAQDNLRTILVDADLRHPVLHQVFNVRNKNGMADLINSAETDLHDYLKSTFINNLMILTSGEVSRSRAARLSSERISEILDCLEELADVVIIDSPPALLTADAMTLSNQADGVVVVIRAGKTRRKAVKQTLTDLREANANLIGCIYNQANEKQMPSYFY